MPGIGNPLYTQQGGTSWFEGLQHDPDFQKLSPASQQILAQYGQQVDTQGRRGQVAFQQAMKSDPALQKVMAEAKSVGALDHPMSPLMKALTIGTVGLVTAGAALPFLAGGAAVSGAAGAGAGAAGASAGGAGSLGGILSTAIPTGISAAAGIYGANQQRNATNNAAQLQTEAANHAADLESKSAAELLAFQKEQEAQRKAEWEKAQQANYELEQARLARLAPFRQTGVNSLGQLLQPIRQRQPGSLGGMLGV